MGDFTGFSFNGVHINNVRIVRVSDGNRYNDTILPTFTDKTVAVPGGNGTYFFGSYYTQKPFTLQVAFDELTEEDLRTLRQVFNGQVVGDLVFDEEPYKRYIVKVQSAPQFKYLCFDTETNSIINNLYEFNETYQGRIYKGEGTIQFVAYKPFARCPVKYLASYVNPNKGEWASSSGLLASNPITIDNVQYTFDSYTDTSANSSVSGKFLLFNPGDLDTDFRLVLPTDYFNKLTSISLGTNELNFTTKEVSDAFICIDTKANLVYGTTISGNNSMSGFTGNIYNKYIESGDFFKIPIQNIVDADFILALQYSASISGTGNPAIYYDYLYY